MNDTGQLIDLAAIAPLLAELPWDELPTMVERALCERSLIEFVKAAWPHFESSEYIDGWHLHAICEHLEAVSRGEIRRILINIPPRHSKTTLSTICWPVWTWAQQSDPENPLVGPGVRFLCASYGANKAQQDGVTARRLIGSPWFQGLWGGRVRIVKDRDNMEQYDTSAGGSRISTGVPESLGKGGLIRIIDDPSKTDEVESERVMETTIRAYDEVWSTRSNSATIGAEVIIMQRLGMNDLSGHVLDRGDWVHLCLPARYEAQRHCRTVIGWSDPRKVEGEILSPERFPEVEMRNLEKTTTRYAWAGQFQQRPSPRGGGIIQDEWWQVWPPVDEEEIWSREWVDDEGIVRKSATFPDWDLVIVSVDTAYTTDATNDWSALTVWGLFTYSDRSGIEREGIMLVGADRVRLELHELVGHVKRTCERRKADILLIEGKASGLSVSQEIRRLVRGSEYRMVVVEPKGDKVARVHSVAPLFAGGMIWAPNKKWAQEVIDEIGAFPTGKHDDYVDATTQALFWLRKNGIARLRVEREEDEIELRTFVGNRESIVDEYEN